MRAGIIADPRSIAWLTSRRWPSAAAAQRLMGDRVQSVGRYYGVQVNPPQSIVTGNVHPDAVVAVKVRIKATMILLVRRDIQLPPFVPERSVAGYMNLCHPG